MPTEAARPVRLAIINDYPLVVAGLATLLAPYRERVVVIEIASSAPVASVVDLVLYDTFAWSPKSPIDIRELCSTHRVIVYAWNLTAPSIAMARRVGAVAVFSKGLPADELVSGIELLAVDTGFTVLRSGLEESVAPMPQLATEHRLSPRELEVLALVAQGLTNQDIADALFVSINSVKTYIRSGYRKINVERRAQAVAWGLGNGLQAARTRVVVDDPTE